MLNQIRVEDKNFHDFLSSVDIFQNYHKFSKFLTGILSDDQSVIILDLDHACYFLLFCQASFGPKLFAKVISRTTAGKC